MPSPPHRHSAVHALIAALALMMIDLPAMQAAAATKIVALGASNTAGWGVGEANAYPAQLQALLRAQGYNVEVVNAGKSFDTTNGMLSRLDGALVPGTSIVIVQPGGNDMRFFGSEQQRAANLAEMRKRLAARHIRMIVFENAVVPSNLYQWDHIHFTAAGHKAAAAYLARQVGPLLGGH